LIQYPLVIDAPIAMRAFEMLDAETNRREWVFDLVRHLACHLTPRKHTLRSCQLRDVVERENRAGPSAESRHPPMDLSAVKLEIELFLVVASLVLHERADAFR